MFQLAKSGSGVPTVETDPGQEEARGYGQPRPRTCHLPSAEDQQPLRHHLGGLGSQPRQLRGGKAARTFERLQTSTLSLCPLAQ